MIIKYSVAGAAIAFICLDVVLIKALRKSMRTIDEATHTLSEVREAVQDLSVETKQLIHTANQVAVDVQGKVQATQPLVESAHDVGDIVHDVTSTVKRAADAFAKALPVRQGSPAVSRGVRIKINS